MAWGRRTTSAQTPAWSQDDYHKEFAGKLKEQIAQGVAPWQKPWKPGESRLPQNLQTDKPYRGGNSVYLSVTQWEARKRTPSPLFWSRRPPTRVAFSPLRT